MWPYTYKFLSVYMYDLTLINFFKFIWPYTYKFLYVYMTLDL